MSNIMKVLIAYDGSPESEIALQDLRRAGLPPDVDAILLTVADASDSTAWQMEEAFSIAETGCHNLRSAFANWRVQPQVSAGAPAWEIFWKSEELHAGLVVVGAHDHLRLDHLRLGDIFLGSVADTVLTQAFCSVRVGRNRGADSQQPLRLMIGIDGSRGAEETIEVVSQRLWPANSEARLVVGVEPGHLASMASALVLYDLSLKEQHKAAQLQAEKIAQDAAEMIALHNPGLNVSTWIKAGDPKNVLLEEAEQWGADCIFLGGRGHNWSVRQMVGNVALAVATHANCSVEIVRSRHALPPHNYQPQLDDAS